MGMQRRLSVALDKLSEGSPYSNEIQSIKNHINAPDIRIPNNDNEGVIALTCEMEINHPGIIVDSPNNQAMYDLITDCVDNYSNDLGPSPYKSI